ncbi:MAG: hypothetical protein WCE49_10430, partial [Terrimicrobiaceae bacterium]
YALTVSPPEEHSHRIFLRFKAQAPDERFLQLLARFVHEPFLLLTVEPMVFGDVIMRRQQEPACAARWIADRYRQSGIGPRLRGDRIDDGGDEWARREVLARAAFHVLGVLWGCSCSL